MEIEPLLTLSLEGSSFVKGWEFTAELGMNDFIRDVGGPGVAVMKTRFSEGLGGLPNMRAMQTFSLFLPSEAVRAFPGVVFEGGFRRRPGNQDALEMLVAEAARAGAKMLIGCLRNHPNPAVRDQFISTISRNELVASLL